MAAAIATFKLEIFLFINIYKAEKDKIWLFLYSFQYSLSAHY